jgi:hypothetical protein
MPYRECSTATGAKQRRYIQPVGIGYVAWNVAGVLRVVQIRSARNVLSIAEKPTKN